MTATRRDFIESALLGAATAALTPNAAAARDHERKPLQHPAPGATGERMAPSLASEFRSYTSKIASTPDVETWVQIDLGSSRRIDGIRLYPFARPGGLDGQGFPIRFYIACSDDSNFRTSHFIADWRSRDYPNPRDNIVEFPAHRALGRYVRLTALRLSPQIAFDVEEATNIRTTALESMTKLTSGKFVLCISKMEVLAAGRDMAVHCKVSVDDAYGNPNDAPQLTRSPRPLGEGIVTDNPGNVTSAERWKPAVLSAEVPKSGVRLGHGVFRKTMEKNIAYLLKSYTLNDLLYEFRKRAGKPTAAPAKQNDFWDGVLAGSGAGRFLMGAGNAVRWIEHDELQQRMHALVEGIAECRESDGYIMAYAKNTFFKSERGGYARAWLTHGLIDAAQGGNRKALDLLRGYYDWYNEQDFLPKALRGVEQGPQATVANTRMYFTPVGKPKDLQVVQRYLQENYLLERLSKRDPSCIWQYPYDRPHCYIITFLEAYLDLYIATGEARYLDAVLGGWDLFRDKWQYPGGAFSISEGIPSPPNSNSIYYRRIGELCGSAFWIKLNQRLHMLLPTEEKYVSEIEKSIYNVILSNITEDGVRYHTRLVSDKERPQSINTCCEGQGSRIACSLPEYIYSVTPNGVFINLFEESAISFRVGGREIRLEMLTRFPVTNQVSIAVRTTDPTDMKVRVRVPNWSTGVMNILVNGKVFATGSPGTYVSLDRTWSPDDEISFELLPDFQMTEYTGVDQIVGRKRFSLMYGPLLMAIAGVGEMGIQLKGCLRPTELPERLERKNPDRLVFTAQLNTGEWQPYYEISDDLFTCFPSVDCDFNPSYL